MAYTMAQAAFALYSGGGTANFARRRRGKKGSRVLGRTRAGRIARGAGAVGLLGGGIALAMRRKKGGGALPPMGVAGMRALPGASIGQRALPGRGGALVVPDAIPIKTRPVSRGGGRSQRALPGGSQLALPAGRTIVNRGGRDRRQIAPQRAGNGFVMVRGG